jgi:hypothetical protein
MGNCTIYSTVRYVDRRSMLARGINVVMHRLVDLSNIFWVHSAFRYGWTNRLTDRKSFEADAFFAYAAVYNSAAMRRAHNKAEKTQMRSL